jgi:hypothetical protein
MIPGSKFVRVTGIILLSAASVAATSQTHKTHKKKQVPIHPLPSGPTGPIQQIPLDSMAPVPPHVSYENGQLTIVAANSTLGDILKAVRKQTGADIDVPDAKERVVTHLGPGPAQDVIADLLNGSRFNYVLLGSPQNPAVLTKVVLVARSTPDTGNHPTPQQPVAAVQPPSPEAQADAAGNDADATPPEENTVDENPPDQAAVENGDQPQGQPDNPPGVKTPQELLQEMQQRQLQMQQQMGGSPGAPPAPGAGIPPTAPQEK